LPDEVLWGDRGDPAPRIAPPPILGPATTLGRDFAASINQDSPRLAVLADSIPCSAGRNFESEERAPAGTRTKKQAENQAGEPQVWGILKKKQTFDSITPLSDRVGLTPITVRFGAIFSSTGGVAGYKTPCLRFRSGITGTAHRKTW